MGSVICGPGIENLQSAQVQTVFVGDFESPEHATELLRKHLHGLLAFFENRVLVSPLDLGAVSRSFLKILLESPCSIDDPDNMPTHLFESGFVEINWPEFQAALGVDDAEIASRIEAEHEIAMEFWKRGAA